MAHALKESLVRAVQYAVQVRTAVRRRNAFCGACRGVYQVYKQPVSHQVCNPNPADSPYPKLLPAFCPSSYRSAIILAIVRYSFGDLLAIVSQSFDNRLAIAWQSFSDR
jgi:hypothetical protein